MRTILALVSILILSSCSSITPIQKKRPLTEREKILEYYRSLREKDRKNKYRNKKYIRAKKFTYKPKKIRKPKIKLVDINEQRIEIEQRLVFFCMENRKSSKFDANDTCESHTALIYSKCLDSFEAGDARLTRCVKSRLK
jgi:uncharacterized lipoprotein